MKLAEILSGIHPVHTAGGLDSEIRELAFDSRAVAPNSLFFALSGAHTDGNRHVREAVEKGAAAVVSELTPPPPPFTLLRRRTLDRPVAWIQVSGVLEAMSRASANFYGHPSEKLTTLGVTGTNGKTTVTYFLESILSHAGASTGVIGTVNYRLRGKELSKAPNTTPLSLDLQRLLGRMVRSGATHVAMEVSSHALSLKRVEDVEFDVALFTNLHRDHLDFHKDVDSYFEAKARLFDLLSRASAVKKRRLAVLNLEDPAFLKLKRRVIDADLLTYGLDPRADVSAEGVERRPDGTLFRMRSKYGAWVIKLRLIGDYNVQNALAASAAALWLGLPPQTVAEGLERLALVPGRLEPVLAGQPFSVFVDYAHTDSALENVLRCLGAIPHHRILTVVGCGGDRDKTKRGPMGIAACRASDFVFFTSDNPRSEDPAEILAQIEVGVQKSGHQNYRVVLDRKEAIRAAVSQAHPGDIVLIAGKGHEMYQILKDRTIHFDDREAAREALGGVSSQS